MGDLWFRAVRGGREGRCERECWNWGLRDENGGGHYVRQRAEWDEAGYVAAANRNNVGVSALMELHSSSLRDTQTQAHQSPSASETLMLIQALMPFRITRGKSNQRWVFFWNPGARTLYGPPSVLR